MSEEKHVVEHEQQKERKDKSNTSHFGLSVSFIILIVVLHYSRHLQVCR